MRQQFFIRASYIALIVAIGGIATSNAQAQGFFGSLEGRYVFVGKSQFDALDQFPNGNPTLNLGSSVQPDNGWGGRLFMGYRFGNNWDLGVGGSGGSSTFGAGGTGKVVAGDGNNATGNGAGGGGALTGATAARAGGNGSAGMWIVEEYS